MAVETVVETKPKPEKRLYQTYTSAWPLHRWTDNMPAYGTKGVGRPTLRESELRRMVVTMKRESASNLLGGLVEYGLSPTPLCKAGHDGEGC